MSDICSVCKVRHPKGWACPKKMDRLESRIISLITEVKRRKKQLDEAVEVLEFAEDFGDSQGAIDKFLTSIGVRDE